ncbi:DNA polymerase III subunit delta' [Actinospica durhamensis]|uniref:DNA polymerase III subunit delta n=1 Tax=Actinospica durhamensis TaxID=1508375 RepID=A0A941EQI9_9ACTN|nr:DNA polymerase III subunit delta' [Actinospica durhamensis]MBR7835313.1 DNA polymerase III subunit delta' [Actinospica durhamensis]
MSDDDFEDEYGEEYGAEDDAYADADGDEGGGQPEDDAAAAAWGELADAEAAPVDESGEPAVGAVWAELIGQPEAVGRLGRAAVAARRVLGGATGASVNAMTHAWLLTGPPGSGTGLAARAFAAALQCTGPRPGCGRCPQCRTTLGGTHADVSVVRSDQLSIGVDVARKLVRDCAMAPSGGRWQIIVFEDADRLTEGAANVLLKGIEEPSARTVWILCAPSSRDLLPTILSRCRQLNLRTPAAADVAEALVERAGVGPEQALLAARAAQGDYERARALVLDPQAAARRAAVLRLPVEARDLGRALGAAQALVDAAEAEAKAATEGLDVTETEELKLALGYGQGKGAGSARGVAGSAGLLKELEGRQKRRLTRIQRDCLDRALSDLLAFYRDVLAVQLTGGSGAGHGPEPVHADQRAQVAEIAAGSRPEETLRRVDAILGARQAIAANVAPLLAVEAMAVSLG